ncbi:MAG: amidase [Weeksellaceae bacterium]
MDILGKSIIQLQDLISSKKISSAEVYSYFMARAKKHNNDLNAFLTLVDEQTIKHDGDMAGIPLAVKDNFCTEGVRTTASAKLLEDFVPQYESTVTQRLYDNGATILGKTNLDAWAHGSSTETSDFGPSKNPWDITRAPGGSSGGTGAAVSAYLTPAGIGSETAGSIRLPAAWCGLVGLKPTYGRVSRFGVIAMGSSFDCPGPMTLTVEDSAYLLQLIAGHDPYDATSSTEAVPDYLKQMKEKKKFTIGLPKEYMEGLDADIEKRVRDALKVLESMGHTIKEVSLLPPKYSISVYTILQRAEVSSNLARFDGIRYGKDRTHFGSEAKRRIMLGAYTLSHGHYDAFYTKAQKVKTLIIEDMQRVFQDVDLLIAPSTPVTALTLGEFHKFAFFGETMDALDEAAAVAGTPAINIPFGFDSQGLPVGIQIMGNYFEEGKILDLAYQFEQETKFDGVIEKGVKNYE